MGFFIAFKEIITKTFPLKFKMPLLDKYDSTSDLRSHIANFHMIMQL